MASQDLYEMLGLDKSASQADIKKAYYKLALQWHPDRNSAPEATAKFQALQRVYDVLSNPEKRQLYDRTGSLQDCEEMVQSNNFQELYAAFREALKVTEEDIESFTATYRGSIEERADLLTLYREHNGNMTRVFDWLMLSRPDMDSHRFRDTIEAAIAAGEVKRFKAYKPWSAQVAASPPPSSDPLAPPKKSKGNKKGSKGGSDDSLALVAAIKNKGKSFSGMLAALEAKYAGGGGGKAKKGHKQPAAAVGDSSGSKRKRSSKAAAAAAEVAASEQDSGDGSDDDEQCGADQGQEPTEEQFEAARARLLQKSQQGTADKAVKGGKKQSKAAVTRGSSKGRGTSSTAVAAKKSSTASAVGSKKPKLQKA